MKTTLKSLFLLVMVSGLVACGESEQIGDEEDPIVCGEGTRLEDTSCVPDVECGEGEIATTDGRCVRGDYCGEGTRQSTTSGLCVANTNVICGPNTTGGEDGECVPEFVIECGEGTVVADNECRLPEDVCGDGTTVGGVNQCRPAPGVCGEGTAFDNSTQLCVPLSTLTCGMGTRPDGGVCVPTRAFYEELAAAADVTLSGEPVEVTLGAAGERVVFAGTIDSPEIEDGALVQDEDFLSFQAAPGQWIRLGLYSLGLPEPGFELAGDSLFRRSDRGAGLEVFREVVIPESGEYTMRISNMPQLLGDIGAAGGEDWDYVGYLEVVDAPPADALELPQASLNGNVRTTAQNFYFVEGAQPGQALAFIFTSRPFSATTEIQIWTSETELHSVIPLDSNQITLTAPAEDFHIFIDREYSFGAQTSYNGQFLSGFPLANNATHTVEVELSAGEYVGMTQFNLNGLPLAAAIRDGGTTLASTSELQINSAALGQVSLYGYSPSSGTVTLELTNNTGSSIPFLTTNHTVGTADEIEEIDGTLVEFSTNVAVSARHRHFVVLDVTAANLMVINFSGVATTDLFLYSETGEALAESTGSLVYDFSEGTYLLAVQPRTNITSGFGLSIEETDIFEVSLSQSPGGGFSSTPRTETINVTSCPSILEIEIHVNITHTWRGDLEIDIRGPNGEVKRIHNSSSDLTSNIVATYPFPSDAGLNSGEGLLDFVGTNGAGDWDIVIRDTWTSGTSGTFNSWGIDLLCEG